MMGKFSVRDLQLSVCTGLLMLISLPRISAWDLARLPSCAIKCVENTLSTSDLSCRCRRFDRSSIRLPPCVQNSCSIEDYKLIRKVLLSICHSTDFTEPHSSLTGDIARVELRAPASSSDTVVEYQTTISGSHTTLITTTASTLPSQPVESASEAPPSRGLSAGAKAGIGVGVFLGFILCVIVGVLFYLRKIKKNGGNRYIERYRRKLESGGRRTAGSANTEVGTAGTQESRQSIGNSGSDPEANDVKKAGITRTSTELESLDQTKNELPPSQSLKYELGTKETRRLSRMKEEFG